MRKLFMLWLIGAATIVANISPPSTGSPSYENSFSARAKLAELQAILDAENDDDLDDDVTDPDDEGDMQDDQENSGTGGTTPT